MISITKPDQHPEMEIYYFQEGLLLRSKINLNTHTSGRANYDIPITVVASGRFGLKVFQGLTTYDSINYDIKSLDLDRGIELLEAKTNNWLVFLPAKTYLGSSEELIDDLSNELGIKVSCYKQKSPSFTYGIGVE